MKFEIEQADKLKTADGKEFRIGSRISFLYPNVESDRVHSYSGTIVQLSRNHMVLDQADKSTDMPATVIFLDYIIEGSCKSITA